MSNDDDHDYYDDYAKDSWRTDEWQEKRDELELEYQKEVRSMILPMKEQLEKLKAWEKDKSLSYEFGLKLQEIMNSLDCIDSASEKFDHKIYWDYSRCY